MLGSEKTFPLKKSQSMDKKVVLITGATGNLGSRIMAEMLKDDAITLKLLVYGKNQTETNHEVRKVLDFWECDPTSLARIEILRGDITHKTLGLTPEMYQRLADTITHIIHCAANFKINLSIEEARLSILDGTQHVAALAQAARDRNTFKRFNYISTVEVAGNLEGLIKEEFFAKGSRKFFNTYEQAKAETEEYLLKEYHERALPITVYRPAMLVGDSITGKILNPQSVYHLLTEMLLTPRYPMVPGRSNFHVDPMPLNIIARAMYLMYDDPETLGQVYHLTSGTGRTLTIPEFVAAAQAIYKDLTGIAIKQPYFVSPRWFMPLLSIVRPLTFGKVRAELEVQKTFLELSLLRAEFDNSKAKKFLENRGLVIPGLREYLPTLLTYFHKKQPALALLHIQA